MRVLLVEDEEDKRREVVDILEAELGPVIIDTARSLSSGLAALFSEGHDLVILDMTMPSFDISPNEDGGRPQAFGGLELLAHMRRRGMVAPVIVLTQFDRFGDGQDALNLEELDGRLAEDYPATYLGAVHYDVVSEDWKSRLTQMLEKARRGGSSDA